MFVVIQIPISDLRAFLDAPRNIPFDWCVPELGQSFLKGFGKVRRRLNPSDFLFEDEIFFVDARQLVRFIELEKFRLLGFSHPKCVFRRFFCDNFGMLRFELGIVFRDNEQSVEDLIRNNKLEDLAGGLIKMQVNVKALKESVVKTVELHQAGKFFGTKYLYSTTQPSTVLDLKNNLYPGNPVIFLEYNYGPLQGRVLQEEIGHVDCHWSNIAGNVIPVFLLNRKTWTWDMTRDFRITFLRMNSEIYHLKNILKHKNRKGVKFSEAFVKNYFLEKGKFISSVFGPEKNKKDLSEDKLNALNAFKEHFSNDIRSIKKLLNKYYPDVLISSSSSNENTADPKTEIMELIVEDNLEKAFKKIIALYKKLGKKLDDILVLNSWFNESSRLAGLGISSRDQFLKEKNTIKLSLVKYLNSI